MERSVDGTTFLLQDQHCQTRLSASPPPGPSLASCSRASQRARWRRSFHFLCWVGIAVHRLPMNPSLARLFAVVTLIAASSGWFDQVCQAQSFQFPPYGAQRGRMVARDGIGHSVRYRWGNGLTPTGGAVLSEAITAFAPAVVAFAGRDAEVDADARSRDAARSATRDRLAIAQEQANALLIRTARLIEPDFVASPPAPAGDAIVPPVPTPPSGGFGTDPWPNVPDNSGTSSSTLVPPPGADPWDQVSDNRQDL